MFAPNDVKEVLHDLGFDSEDITPEDDPTYTVFKRLRTDIPHDNRLFEGFSICYYYEGTARSAQEVLDELFGVSSEKE